MASSTPVLRFVPDIRVLTFTCLPLTLPFYFSLPSPPWVLLIFTVVAIPPFFSLILPPFTWAFPPLEQALFDLRDLRAGIAKGRWVLEDLPCAGLLAPLEPTGSPGARAGAPLVPLTHLAVHLWCALHEFVIGLVVLWTDMVTPPAELVQAGPAPCACVTAHTHLTLCRASVNTLPLCFVPHHPFGAVLLALALVKVESCSAVCAEGLVEAGLTVRPALCAGVSFWGSCAIKARRTGSHAHADLLHPNPLQMHEEAWLAGQAAIVVRAGQTATLLAPRAHTRDLFMLPVPGAAVLLTSSVIHAVQDDQNKGDQL